MSRNLTFEVGQAWIKSHASIQELCGSRQVLGSLRAPVHPSGKDNSGTIIIVSESAGIKSVMQLYKILGVGPGTW